MPGKKQYRSPTRLIKAASVKERTAIVFGGTETKPEPLVHATLWKRNGVYVVARPNRMDPGVTEHRADEKLRVGYDFGKDVLRVQMCHQCEVPHPKLIQTDARGSAMCPVRDAEIHARRKAAKQAAKAAGTTYRAPDRKVQAIQERIGRLMTHQAPSKDEMIASVLRARERLFGLDSPSYKAEADAFGLTLDEAHDLVAAVDAARAEPMAEFDVDPAAIAKAQAASDAALQHIADDGGEPAAAPEAEEGQATA